MSINDNRIIDIVAFVEPNYLQSVSNCKISGAARAIEIEKQIVVEWVCVLFVNLFGDEVGVVQLKNKDE